MITRLLIANRGEIARRVNRTAQAMGITTVAVFTDPDADAPHVRECDLAVALGSARAYLDPDALLDAARRAGADAVHPGYGFLSEDASFAEACEAAGLCWVGPPPAAMRAMARKVEAKQVAAALGVPVLPGASVDGSMWTGAAEEIGYPLLVKASAGGGGRGMRIVRDPAELDDAVEAGRREAASSFGDGTVFLERYLERPRHVEVQVMADRYGAVLHLLDRDCSVQRRHQKVIEEAPAPGLPDTVRARMADAAVALTKGIGYVGAGTVEFLVDGEEVAFLEMNTRLQVEHPVTEMVLGLDLVRMQLEVAAGLPLGLAQADVKASGHAVEARLYAENVPAGFLPAPGTVARWRPHRSEGLRYDSAVGDGTVVSPHYDPMIAKIVAAAPTRVEAVARLARAVGNTQAAGLTTNRDMLVAVLRSPEFQDGAVTTAFLDEHPSVVAASPPVPAQATAALVAALAGGYRARQGSPAPASTPAAWRNVPNQPLRRTFEDGLELTYTLGRGGTVEATAAGVDLRGRVARVGPGEDDTVDVELLLDGVLQTWRAFTGPSGLFAMTGPAGAIDLTEVPLLRQVDALAGAGGPMAPLPGTVVQVTVKPGDRVAAGDVLVVIEAMKMEHVIRSHDAAVVDAVLVAVGATVDTGQVLITLAAAE